MTFYVILYVAIIIIIFFFFIDFLFLPFSSPYLIYVRSLFM